MTRSFEGDRASDREGEQRVIPPAVRAMAGEVLHNVSELEVLLLARRWPMHLWNAGAVSRSLKIGHGQAGDSLARLATIGLLQRHDGGYRFHPASPETLQTLDSLAGFYRSHRQAVLRLVFSRSKGAVSYFPPEEQQ